MILGIQRKSSELSLAICVAYNGDRPKIEQILGGEKYEETAVSRYSPARRRIRVPGDFKPTPAQRSFAEQLLHAAGASYYFTNPVMGQKAPAGEDPKRENYKTKADIVAFVKKSVADGAAAIQSKGEKGLMTTVPYGNQEARVLDIAYGLIEHSGEHYGQLVVYYRLAGLVPPESRPKK